MNCARGIRFSLLPLAFVATSVYAETVFYNNDFPDGRVATTSHPDVSGLETETADDFILGSNSRITNGSFTGLLPRGSTPANIKSVVVEIYGVFPSGASINHGNVFTRVNSPSDNAITTRNSGGGGLSYTTSLLNENLAVVNSVLDNGIHADPPNGPGQHTGGNGGVNGQDVRFNFELTTPIDLAGGHYFFVPQVELDNGTFLWLSAAKPISGIGSTPVSPLSADLQTWIRNDASTQTPGDPSIAPDWSRIGADILGNVTNGPDRGVENVALNAAFRLNGIVIPEPNSFVLLAAGLLAVGVWTQRRRS